MPDRMSEERLEEIERQGPGSPPVLLFCELLTELRAERERYVAKAFECGELDAEVCEQKARAEKAEAELKIADQTIQELRDEIADLQFQEGK